MGWQDVFNRQANAKEDEYEVKPETFKKLESIPDNFAEEFKLLKESAAKSATAQEEMAAYFRRQAARDEETAKAQATREAQELANKNKRTIDWENDPQGAVQALTEPLAQANLTLMAENMRRKVLTDDPEFAEFYTGDLKARVDTVLDNEPLVNQNNPNIIKNAYKTVAYDMRKEIEEKKVASRFAATQRSSSGTNGNVVAKPDAASPDSLSDSEKRIAKMMGISAESYAKSKVKISEELAGV